LLGAIDYTAWTGLFRMKLFSLNSALALAFATLLYAPTPVPAQDESPLDPANFSTPIAKKLAGQISEPAELRKTMVGFVNSAQAPLMCKISVSRVWEQVLRSKAGLEGYKQQQIASAAVLEQNLSKVPGKLKGEIAQKAAEASLANEKSLVATLTRELAVTFDLIDAYCAASSAAK